MEINITLTFFPYDIEYVKDKFISTIGTEYNMCHFDDYTSFIERVRLSHYKVDRHEG